MLLAQILQQERLADCGHPCLPNGTDGKDRFNDTLNRAFQVGQKTYAGNFRAISASFLNG